MKKLLLLAFLTLPLACSQQEEIPAAPDYANDAKRDTEKVPGLLSRSFCIHGT